MSFGGHGQITQCPVAEFRRPHPEEQNILVLLPAVALENAQEWLSFDKRKVED